MTLGNRSTYSLDIITETLCSSDHRVDIIRSTLESTLEIYQWYYQVASEKKYDNVKNSSKLAIDKVIKLLKNAGQDSLADDVTDALYNDSATSTLAKSKVLSQAKKHMKMLLLEHNMTPSVYKNDFAVPMEDAFTEWCDEHPLPEAPAHYNNHFEPTFV